MAPSLCLAGLVTGHPLLGGDYITTSPLIALPPELSWARTLSRFYRLKTPLAEAFRLNADTPLLAGDAYGWPAVSIVDARRYLEKLRAFIRSVMAL